MSLRTSKRKSLGKKKTNVKVTERPKKCIRAKNAEMMMCPWLSYAMMNELTMCRSVVAAARIEYIRNVAEKTLPKNSYMI